MKKLVSIVLCLVLTSALLLPAAADVIWEPNDDFYFDHSGECVKLNAAYETALGTVIRKSPTDMTEVGIIPAGSTVQIYYLWEDWGYTECAFGEGWVDFSRFKKVYDAADFATEHASEIFASSGSVSRYEYGTIYYWSYPGAETYDGYINMDTFSWTDEDVPFQYLWRDEYGRRWAYVSYYYGASGWICLDALNYSYIYFETPLPVLDTSVYFYSQPLAVAGLLVTLAVAASAVLIALALRRKKKTDNEPSP